MLGKRPVKVDFQKLGLKVDMTQAQCSGLYQQLHRVAFYLAHRRNVNNLLIAPWCR